MLQIIVGFIVVEAVLLSRELFRFGGVLPHFTADGIPNGHVPLFAFCFLNDLNLDINAPQAGHESKGQKPNKKKKKYKKRGEKNRHFIVPSISNEI